MLFTYPSKRQPLSIIAIFVFALATILSAAPKHPNILFISIDDLRPELGCYGSEVALSPNIDTLANAGTLFENAYCQVPVCGASRASLMTGLYPTPDRFVRFYARADEDAPGIPDLPSWLRQYGYTTISNGKIYHERADNKDSWDEFYRPPDFGIYLLDANKNLPKGQRPAFEAADVPDREYAGGAMTEKLIKDLQRAKEANTPFFITAGYTKPHLPFNAPKKYWDLYDPDALELADNPYMPVGAPRESMHGWHELRNMYAGIPAEGPVSDAMARKLIHGYLACVSYTDAMVGRVLAELDRLEMRDDTIIILWGDHGWQLGEHSLWCKHALFETSLHAPLLIQAPGMKSDQRVESLVEFVDIYPTLCELAGIKAPQHLQGKSMVTLLENPAEPFKEAIFGRYHGGDSVRTADFQYSEWRSGAKMLYDHTKDPDENLNIARNPEQAGRVKKMQKLLQNHKNSL